MLLSGLAAAMLAGVMPGAATVADGAREARAGVGDRQMPATTRAGPAWEQALRRALGGHASTRGPTYRKRPRGTHKQNRRKALGR